MNISRNLDATYCTPVEMIKPAKALPPVIGFAAPSGTGKTTLIEKVISELVDRGIRVAALKHGHHNVEPDQPGKDSYRYRQARASTVVYASKDRWFQIQETPVAEPSLQDHIKRLSDHDLIVVEGYKNSDHDKIVVHRHATGQPPIQDKLSRVIAVATDDEALPANVPIIDLDDAKAVADFIQSHMEFAA